MAADEKHLSAIERLHRREKGATDRFVVASQGPGFNAFLLQTIITYYYNELGGSQGLWIIRDTESALGLVTWLFGCISVAGGPELRFGGSELVSASVLLAATASTMAIQDFRDMERDRASGRRTLPISLGEKKARRVVASLIATWSLGGSFVFARSLLSMVTLGATELALAT
ncbi:hypothetical protein BU26DRAFT_558576 [Trematosphaeria pertusa]|uniref:UbiA prenyltransferase n=1 Tax=Trematosphaeria pertusa TaxID=390896 RepID=A0A6A6J383_9PLEO|nr:uncharacterized protein BU26DRAFT_558576 [Trematosphaeria pertusa]KAF2257169.1 hypothetical protein BU26DRAFT_558576 [Trematosphaeria pertusa]